MQSKSGHKVAERSCDKQLELRLTTNMALLAASSYMYVH
jgi:hypothetical protein